MRQAHPPATASAARGGEPVVTPALVRGSALSGASLFAVIAAGLAYGSQAKWVEYLGIAFHLALLPLVATLRAPSATRAMGYAWIAIDTIVSVVLVNGGDGRLAFDIRLGGHVVAAVWIAGVAAFQPPLPRWTGVGAALCLAGHSLLAPFYGPRPLLLMLAGPLLILWLVIVGLQRPVMTVARGSRPS